MAGAFPDVPDYRMALDIDGTVIRRLTPDGKVWDDMSAAVLANLSDESDDTIGHASTVAETGSYVFAFPRKRRLTGLFASFAQDDPGLPERTNQVPNPSFESGGFGWTPVGGTLTVATPTEPVAGTKHGLFTSNVATFLDGHRITGAVIPSKKGAFWQGSITVINTSDTTRLFTPTIWFYTGASAVTRVDGASVSLAAGEQVRLFTKAIHVNAACDGARLFVYAPTDMAIGQTFELDACMFETVPDFDAPYGDYFDGKSRYCLWSGRASYSSSLQRPIQTTDRVNLCTNPSFEIDTTDWSGYWGALSVVSDPAAPSGGKYARYTSTVNNTGSGTPNFMRHEPFIPVVGLETYSASAWVRCSKANPLTFFLRANKGSGANVGDLTTTYALVANVWTYVTVKGVVPKGSDNLRLHWWTMGGLSVGATIDVDMVMIEQSPVIGPYFDGDSPEAAWADAPHASSSTLSAYNGINWASVAVDVSEDTINGVDGTWDEVVIPGWIYDGETYGQFGELTVPGYRSGIMAGLNIPSTRAVRFRMDGRNPDAGWAFRTCHFYGDRDYEPEADSRYLVFYHPTLDQAVFPEYFDFGNVGDGDSLERTFRLRNLSRLLGAGDVLISLASLTDTVPSVRDTYVLSADKRSFGTELVVKTLPPGGVTEVMTLRKVTPYNAVNGPWTVRMRAQVGTWG